MIIMIIFIIVIMIMMIIILIMIILAPISVEVSKGGKGEPKAAFGDPPVSYVPSAELVLKISCDMKCHMIALLSYDHHIIILSVS